MTDTTEPQPPTSGPEWERPMTMDHVTYTWPDVPPTATDHVTGARVHGLIDHQLDQLAATLFNSIDKLEQHIEQRAHEIAEPRVTDIEETAAERVALAHDERDQWRQRFTDLQREHERQRAVLERRADRAEAANTRVRQLIDSYPPGSYFVTSGAAAIFRDTLNGTLGQDGGTYRG